MGQWRWGIELRCMIMILKSIRETEATTLHTREIVQCIYSVEIPGMKRVVSSMTGCKPISELSLIIPLMHGIKIRLSW
jgi:hypothetical protein